MSADRGRRTISDADVEAIATVLADTLQKRFYEDLGKGVWSWVWKALIAVLLAVAAYGGVKGIK